jgi:hypothetical protein
MKDSKTGIRLLFDLHFDSQAALLEAFQRVGDQPRLLSCSLETEDLRLRYVLPEEDAPALAERIYLSGGLLWCTRHVLPAESAPLDPALDGKPVPLAQP